MIRLSRRGWNNVLILSVLFMLVLFNSSQWLQQSSDRLIETRPLLLADQVLLALEFDEIKIERAGQSWRFNGAGTFKYSPSDYAIAWQRLMMQPIPQAQLDKGYVVSAWLAGQEKAQIYTLLPIGQDLIVELDGLTYRIESTSIETLIPISN